MIWEEQTGVATIRARSYRVPRGHLLKWSFTLIELLVVISIIALLIALILPALKNARATAQTAVCMSNSRQVTGAVTTYVYDNNGWYPRFMATLDNDPDLWKGYTHYFITLKPYFNDWDVLVDPARKNPGPATSYRNYTMVGHSYLIYDPRVISWGQGLRTRIDDVVIPAKTQLTKCIYYWRASDEMPGLYGKSTLPDRHVAPVGGGIHNSKRVFTFIDNHSGLYSTEPAREWFDATETFAFTYPPNVSPTEAEWWTMPYYPDAYPWSLYTAIFP